MEADLAIVGAGPAGAAAACHFSRAGFRVVLMDQQAFPRDKVCGDFVGPWALQEIDRLGLFSEAPFRDANKIFRAEFYLNGNKIVEAPIPHLPGLRNYGLCIPRLQMDHAIASAAIESGAHLLQARVTGYETDANGVTVYYQDGARMQSLRARLLLGADGSTSLIARILRGKQVPKCDRIIAVRAYFGGVSGQIDQAALYADASVFPGYYWLFPLGADSANVGIGMLLETWPANGEHLRQRLLNLIRSGSAIRGRLANSVMHGKIVGWPLSTFDPRLSVVADRVALIGEAAGLINPLNGEGIQYALHSARWSFEAMADALSGDDLASSRLTPYVARVHSEMRFDMAISRLFVDLSRNRTLNKVWLSAIETVGKRAAIDREYGNVSGGVLAGVTNASQMLAIPFIWRTLKQAAVMTQETAAIDSIRALVSMAKYSVQHPAATLTWSTQCLFAMFEVATQMAQRSGAG